MSFKKVGSGCKPGTAFQRHASHDASATRHKPSILMMLRGLSDGWRLRIQGLTGYRLFLNFGGNLAPDFLASHIAAACKLFRAFFDFIVGVETVTRPTKARIHHNRIFMRRPHIALPRTINPTNWNSVAGAC